MSKRVRIEMHDRPSVEDLEQLYRKETRDNILKSHYQIIWLLAKGVKVDAVKLMTGYSRGWIYELAIGYNREGVSSLGDRRKTHPGGVPLLNVAQMQQLQKMVIAANRERRHLSGVDVAEWMSKQLDRPVTRQRGWEYLKKAANVDTELVEHPLRSGVEKKPRFRRVLYRAT